MFHWLRALLSPRRSRRMLLLRRPSFDGLLGVHPVSDHWGWDRGTPVDRYYIDQFLTRHAADVRGRALEVKDAAYIRRFDHGVTSIDVLDIDRDNREATIIADLSVGDGIPEARFDCFVLTQTLQYVYDVRAAVEQCHRLLAPGGVLLVTLPTLSRIDHHAGLAHDYWRFTSGSCTRLFGDVFGVERIEVQSWGNVLASVAFLRGTSYEEIPRHKLDVDDPYFPLVITVRAVKGDPA